MNFRSTLCAGLMLLMGISLQAQTSRSGIEIDYNRPKTYVVGGVGVEGNHYFSENQILQLTVTSRMWP